VRMRKGERIFCSRILTAAAKSLHFGIRFIRESY